MHRVRAACAFATLLALLLAGCLGGDEPVAMRTVAQGQHAGLSEPIEQVFTDAESWRTFWRERLRGDGELPSVDFQNERVALVALGERPNGCWGVTIANATRMGAVIVLRVVVQEPAPTAECPEAVVTPYHAVAIPQGTEEVRFARTTTPGSAAEGGEAAVAFTTIARGTDSGIEEAYEMVVEDAQTWEAHWARHQANRIPPEPAPTVDFARQRVVAVALGMQPNLCHHVAVEEVARADDTLVVRYVHETPPPGTGCAQAIGYPFHFVAVEADGTPVRFESATRQGPPPEEPSASRGPRASTL